MGRWVGVAKEVENRPKKKSSYLTGLHKAEIHTCKTGNKNWEFVLVWYFNL